MISFEGFRWDAPGWRLDSEEPGRSIWLNVHGDGLVAQRSTMPPDIPAMGGDDAEKATQDYYRDAMLGMGGGIIDVRYGALSGLRAVRTLVKRRLEPRGFAFLGSWLIPFTSNFLAFRFECYEQGVTGGREAAVMLIEHPNPGVDAAGRILGWCKDPYDPRYDDVALCNLADAEKYDHAFPDHPLSRARAHLDAFRDGVVVNPLLLARTQHLA